MKKFILGCLLMISTTGFAKTANPEAAYSFLNNWSASAPTITKVNGDVISSRMLERYVKVGNDKVPVAVMTIGEIRAHSKKGVPTDFAGAIAKLMHIKHWKKETRGTYTAYEAEAPEAARFVKIFVSKDTKVYRYSMISMRTAFMLPTYYESEIIQREQMNDQKGVVDLEKPTSAVAQIYRLLLGSTPAEAMSLDDLLNILSSNASSVGTAADNVSTFTHTSVASVNNLTGTVSSGVTTLSNTVTSGVGTVVSTANNITGQVTSTVNSAVGNLGTIVSGAEKSASSDVNTINNAVNKVMNPVTEGKAFFGAALGYSLGAELAAFAGDGLVTACKEVFNAITGNLPESVKDGLNDQGQKAWADLERLSKEALELDKQMQLTMASLNLLTGKDVTDMDFGAEKYRIDYNLRQIRNAEDKLKSAQDRNVCFQAEKQENIKLLIVQNLEPILDSPRGKSADELCRSFDDLYQQWANVEMQIANARAVLMNNMAYMLTGAAKTAAKANKSSTTHYEDQENCQDLEKQINKDDSEIGKNNCYRNSIGMSDTCTNLFGIHDNDVATWNNCKDIVTMKQGRDVTSDQFISSATVRQASDMMRDSYKRLQSSYCEPDSTKPGCDGKQGSFAQIHDAMQARFAQVQAKCPNTIAKADPAANQAGAQKAAAVAASDVPMSSLPASQAPTASDAPGFFGQMGEHISNFLHSIF